jgi:hypothetical protein
MATVAFTKATKRRKKARIAIMGPTGSGKTWTALEIARGLVGDDGRIAVIDTERGSASLYEERTPFDVLELTSCAPERYVEAITAATAAGYDALVIDSWSHAWAGKDGLLEFVDAQKKKNRGNDFVVWGDATPKQNHMVDAILSAPLHIVVTMRSKMAYVLEEQDRGGRKVQIPRKVGLQPIQRDGVEYEFDVVADMDLDHNLMIAKTRCSVLADQVLRKPTRALGETLRAWLEDGAAPIVAPVVAPAPTPVPAPAPTSSPSPRTDDHAPQSIAALAADVGVSVAKICASYSVESLDHLTADQAAEARRKLEARRTKGAA